MVISGALAPGATAVEGDQTALMSIRISPFLFFPNITFEQPL
jgi:hypothetical protein